MKVLGFAALLLFWCSFPAIAHGNNNETLKQQGEMLKEETHQAQQELRKLSSLWVLRGEFLAIDFKPREALQAYKNALIADPHNKTAQALEKRMEKALR